MTKHLEDLINKKDIQGIKDQMILAIGLGFGLGFIVCGILTKLKEILL